MIESVIQPMGVLLRLLTTVVRLHLAQVLTITYQANGIEPADACNDFVADSLLGRHLGVGLSEVLDCFKK